MKIALGGNAVLSASNATGNDTLKNAKQRTGSASSRRSGADDRLNARLTVPPHTSFAMPGEPGRVRFVVANESDEGVRIVASAFEIKRALIGAPHSLPRDGWGYASTDAIAPGTALPARCELWLMVHAHPRTTFGGVIRIEPVSEREPQYYVAGRIVYRTQTGEMRESAFHRRLNYADMTLSVVDPGDIDLNYNARPLR